MCVPISDALVVPHKTTGEVIIAARNGNVDLAVDFIAPLLSSISRPFSILPKSCVRNSRSWSISPSRVAS